MEKRRVMISKRLQMVASLVTKGYRMADVGTDHGFVPIYLVKTGVCPSALAMDVRSGPLERAREHIREYGLERQIETRLSDGVSELKVGEADSVVIAGMGGPLTVRILQEGRTVLESVKELILSPHTEAVSVRRYLQDSGWYIEEEHMVYDEGKYYVFLKATHGQGDYESHADFYFGKRLMEKAEPDWEQYLNKGFFKLKQLEMRLATQDSARAKMRLGEVRAQIEEMRHVLMRLDGIGKMQNWEDEDKGEK